MRHNGLLKGADERLGALIRILSDSQYADYDLAVRNLASADEAIVLRIAKVDRVRLDYVQGLFQDLRFVGADLVKNPQGLVSGRIAEVGESLVCTGIIVAAELRFEDRKRESMRLAAQVGQSQLCASSP